MSLYKKRAVIPAEGPAEKTYDQAEPAKRRLGGLAPAVGHAMAGDGSGDLWSNGRWAVTEGALECRCVIAGVPMDYVIEKARLLRVAPGTSVSEFAMQLAGKTWLDDLDAMLEALTAALNLLHPGQTAVDLAATRERATREWHRTRIRRVDDSPGYDYVSGGATLRRIDGLAEAPAGGAAPTRPRDPDLEEPWITAAVERVRRALVDHGVDPGAHTGGSYVNEGLVALAMAGVGAKELAAAADRLKEAHVARAEKEDEIDIHDDVEFLAEEGR